MVDHRFRFSEKVFLISFHTFSFNLTYIPAFRARSLIVKSTCTYMDTHTGHKCGNWFIIMSQFNLVSFRPKF